MAGDNSDDGAVGGLPTPRIRPHWWAVLAVSVSLLALVAATSGHPDATGSRAAASRASAPRHTSSSTAPPSTTSTTATTTTEPGRGQSTVIPPTSPSTAAAASSTEAARVVVRAAGPTPTTTTTTAAAPADGAGVAAPVQTVAPTELSGNLQQPDDASASYPFTGAGSMEVSASSTSSVPLLLTVTCPQGTVDQAGSSSVSVVIPDADGPCDLVLKETVVQYVAVPYTLTIGPEGG